MRSMEIDNYITSIQNPKIKQLLQLQIKSQLRRKEELFVVEGQREVFHCIKSGYDIKTFFCCEELFNDTEYTSVIRAQMSRTKCFTVSRKVYEKIAYRSSTEGIIAEAKSPCYSLSDLKLSDRPLILVLQSVEKPGNLGAMLRSADASGADAMIICDPLTDIYNPNLIRSSIGAVFSVPCITCSTDECLSFLKSHNVQILTAQLQDSKAYYDSDMTVSTAIVMGTESTGLTSEWRKAADAHIHIPMLGQLDSLNVSVSAAILLFEAIRQRQRTT